jgi:hypothetical protein
VQADQIVDIYFPCNIISYTGSFLSRSTQESGLSDKKDEKREGEELKKTERRHKLTEIQKKKLLED